MVSVVIPVFNAEKHIHDCFQSLSKQTLKSLEFIFIDDGSSDLSLEKIQEIQKLDQRVSYYSKINEGAGIARNAGIELARGKYIGFMDVDDDISPLMFEKLVAAAEIHDGDSVSCGHYLIHESGKKEAKADVLDTTILADETSIAEFQLDLVGPAVKDSNIRLYSNSVWCTLFKRSLIESHNIRFYSERYIVSEDLVFRLQYLKFTRRIVLIPDLLYYYSKNEGSLTKTIFPDKFYRMFQLKQLLKEILIDTSDVDRINRSIADYLRSMLTMSMFINGMYITGLFIKEIVFSAQFAELQGEFPSTKILDKSKRIFYQLLIDKNIRLALLYLFLIKVYKGLKSQKS